MGFMDKAKKLAEQAQEKLDEAQKNFNKGKGSSGSQPAEGGVKYDEHGRPIQETPAGATPPPAADPTPSAPAGSGPSAPPPPAPAEGQDGGDDDDSSPDPFKPLQQ
jgi:hypothetical protein